MYIYFLRELGFIWLIVITTIMFQHPEEIATMAIDLLAAVKQIKIPQNQYQCLNLRIGIHTGKLNNYILLLKCTLIIVKAINRHALRFFIFQPDYMNYRSKVVNFSKARLLIVCFMLISYAIM